MLSTFQQHDRKMEQYIFRAHKLYLRNTSNDRGYANVAKKYIIQPSFRYHSSLFASDIFVKNGSIL